MDSVEKFPEISPKCLASCPRLQAILLAIEVHEEANQDAVEFGMGEGSIEEAIRRTHLQEASGELPKPLNELTAAIRMEVAERIKQRDDAIDRSSGFIAQIGKGCEQPHTCETTDQIGRVVTITACMSPNLPEGKGREIVNIVRKNDQKLDRK